MRSIFLQSLAILGLMLWMTQAEANQCRDLFSSRFIESSQLREKFQAENAELILTSEKQNLRFIHKVLKSRPSEGFISAYSARMKWLNDELIRNKELVTALTNYHKRLVLEQVSVFQERHPDIRINIYSDFKAIMLFVEAPMSAELVREVELIHQVSRQRFFSDPVVTKIVRAEDLTGDWFQRAHEQSLGQMTAVMRFMRNSGDQGLRRYSDPEVQRYLTNTLREVQSLHGRLVEKLRDTSFVQERQLITELYVLARKAASVEELYHQIARIELENASKVFDTDLASYLFKYSRLVDFFSPDLLIAKREILTVDEAPYGALSVDFVGLGGENLKFTAEALVRSRDVEEALVLARQGEQKMTEIFEQRKSKLAEVIQSFFKPQAQNDSVIIKFSGDDGRIIPSRPLSLSDHLGLLDAISKYFPSPAYRLSFVPPGGAKGAESQLSTHGELIVKKFRKVLLSQLSYKLERSVMAQINMPAEVEGGKVFLLLRISQEVSPQDRRVIRQVFQSAIKDMDASLKQTGEGARYSFGDVYAIIGQ